MNPWRSYSRSVCGVVMAGALLLGAGCSNPFVARHKVLVDSIAAPGYARPPSQSYRLVAKKSMVNQAQAQVQVIKACIDAALAAKGMFEAPPNGPPDIFIEVTYGVDTRPRVDPSTRETFLQLSARANPDQAIEKGTGPELWDVRVAVLGVAGRIESAMPLLCTVATDYMGTDTKIETKIEIPQNSPIVKSVRETAIKALEEKSAPAVNAAPSAPPPAPPPESAPKTDATAAGAGAASTAAPVPGK